MEQGEISCISIGRWDAEETPMRVLSQGGSRPSAAERKAERAAEANGERPMAGQHGSSSGNAGPPDLLTLGLPSCSSPTPKDRTQSTDTLFFPPTCSRVGTHICVCVRTPLTALVAHMRSCVHPSQSLQAS